MSIFLTTIRRNDYIMAMATVDSMFSVASVRSSTEEDDIRLQNLQREISNDVRKYIEQKAMVKRLSDALTEALQESLDANKDSLELLLKEHP